MKLDEEDVILCIATLAILPPLIWPVLQTPSGVSSLNLGRALCAAFFCGCEAWGEARKHRLVVHSSQPMLPGDGRREANGKAVRRPRTSRLRPRILARLPARRSPRAVSSSPFRINVSPSPANICPPIISPAKAGKKIHPAKMIKAGLHRTW